MTATINYDQPVRNLIDGLTATGHLGASGQPTHRTFRKTMVTLHHNGGVGFSHQDILNIWKTRPASAHFNVDSAGTVAQYVRPTEYAWACANRVGNETSISIEMANQSGRPNWLVAETTWKAAARLAGWLFAHVIGARPTSANLVYHHHWFATACAGPYMDKVYAQVLAEAQRAYDMFRAGGGGGTSAPSPRPPAPTRSLTVKDIDLRDVTPNVTGPGVKPMQRLLRVTADGYAGPATRAALGAAQKRAGLRVDYIFGSHTAEALLAGK